MAGFRRDERIRRRPEFQQVYERGTRVHGAFFTVFMLPTQAASGAGRLGIAATKKLGGAVSRNRAKRLIREVFRRTKIAPGFDVVVVPKREMLDASQTALEAEYRSIIERSRRRSARPAPSEANRPAKGEPRRVAGARPASSL
jgi:ribonuclease P protein component